MDKVRQPEILHRLSSRKSFVAILLFLVLAVTQSSAFLTAVGALTIPDGDIHANSTYALATGQIFNAAEKQKDRFGNTVNVQYLTGDTRYLSRPGAPNVVISETLAPFPVVTDQFLDQQKSASSMQSATITIPGDNLPSNRSNQYFFLGYVPQAIGFKVADFLNLPVYGHWQSARIMNLIVFIALGVFCIMLVPPGQGKFLFAGFLSFPPIVFIASSLMLDSMLIVVSALVVALVMRAASKTVQLSAAMLVSFSLCVSFLILEKFVYGALGFLFLLLPSSTLSKKLKVLLSSLLLVVLGFAVIWMQTQGGLLAMTNTHEGVSFVITHLLHTTLSLVYNCFVTVPLSLLYGSKVIVLVLFALIVVWIVYLVKRPWYSIGGAKGFVSDNRFGVAAIALYFLIAGLTLGAILVTWNAPSYLQNHYFIEGWQERYAYPLLFLMPLLLTTMPHLKSI